MDSSVNFMQSLLSSVETKLADTVISGSAMALAAGGGIEREGTIEPEDATKAEAEAAAGAGFALTRCLVNMKAEMMLNVFILDG